MRRSRRWKGGRLLDHINTVSQRASFLVLGQLLFHIKILPTILTRQLLGAGGSAVLLGSVGRLEPLSALSGTRHLEDEAIPEKKNVINCVCVAYIFRLTLWEHPTSCN